MPKIKSVEDLVKETLALQSKINAGIEKENSLKKDKTKKLPTFNLSAEQIRKNIEDKYETYKNCNLFLNDNNLTERDNKRHIAKNGLTTQKENFREPFYLNSTNAFKAYGDVEFKDVVKQVNTPAKTRDFKMSLISSHVNSNHIDAIKASQDPDDALLYFTRNPKQVFLGADFSQIRSDSENAKDKIGFNISGELNNELEKDKKYFEDPYKGIMSQVNFSASPLSFLFGKGNDIDNEHAEAIKCGVNSLSFVDEKNVDDLIDLKEAASGVKNITNEKKNEYIQSGLELGGKEQNDIQPVLGNAKNLVNNEKGKYSIDAYKDRFNDQKRSVPLGLNEFAAMKLGTLDIQNKVTKEIKEEHASYGIHAASNLIDGEREFDNQIKIDNNLDFMQQAIKDEYELKNMSGLTKFFSGFTKPNEENKNCAYLKAKVEQNKKFMEDNNMLDSYNNAFATYEKEKENQKKQAQERKQEEKKQSDLDKLHKSPGYQLDQLLKTPASKGPTVMEVGDKNFNRREAANIKKEMNQIHNKSGFLSRQISRLIPDFLLDFGPFRWIMKNLVPFGIGRSIINAADSRREIQKFNRQMDRGYLGNPLGKFNQDPTLSPQQKAVADYKANYKSILKDYYSTNTAGRFGSNFIPKSWTQTGRYKLDIQNNDEMLQDIIGPLSSSDLNKMKKEMLDEFLSEQKMNKNKDLEREKNLDKDALDKALNQNKEKDLINNKELNKEISPTIQQNELNEKSNNNFEHLNNFQQEKKDIQNNNEQIINNDNFNINNINNNEHLNQNENQNLNIKNEFDNEFKIGEDKFLGDKNENRKQLFFDELNQKNSSPEYLTEQDLGMGLELNRKKENDIKDINL